MPPLIVRPSSRPLFRTCPSSQLPTEHPVRAPSEASALGTAVHEAIPSLLDDEDPPLRLLAAEHQVDLDELAELVDAARFALETFRPHFQSPVTEYRLDSPLGGGTADLVDLEADIVLDWKTGRVERDYREQLLHYAYALTHEDQERGPVKGIVVWLRHRSWEVYDFSPEDLAAFPARHEALVMHTGRDYNPGPHCAFCPRQNVCSARAQHVRSSIAALEPLKGRELTTSDLVALYPKAKVVEQLLEQYRDALRAAVLRDGAQPTKDGWELGINEVARKDLDARAAWPLLTEQLSEDELAAATVIKNTALEQAIKAKAPRGQKGKVVKQLWEQLEQRGAVSRRVSQRLEERRIRE